MLAWVSCVKLTKCPIIQYCNIINLAALHQGPDDLWEDVPRWMHLQEVLLLVASQVSPGPGQDDWKVEY